MQLDVPTLMVAGAFVALMSSALLLFAWYQFRETAAALWWAGADFVLACAIVLMAVGSGIDKPLIFVCGLTLLCASSALTWAGARSFDGNAALPLFLALGTLVWIGAHCLPGVVLNPGASALLNAAITLSYYAAAALNIKRGRGEALRARFPLVVLLTMHALTLLIAVPSTLTMTLLPNQPPPVLSWFGVIHFETIIFAIGTAIFLIIMMKERSEQRLLEASHTDVLTGIANRRGFLLKAERVLERCWRDGAPVAVVVFDLDHFKAINDNFGHATGDRVLKIFAEVCGRMLRPSDVIGRIGGEEFAAILPGSGIEAGYAVAERMRKAVAETGAMIDNSWVNCTVSGGVAAGAAPDNDTHALLRQADAGLYSAKSLGRDRIVCSQPSGQSATTANVIRVA
jgi:diguanylate cyclase (GGDEF)-like protein